MTTRRLAAILAADVVGFSSMMEKDEEGMAARMRKLRGEVIAPALERHHGRLVKSTGDGFLAEFASPLDAVRSAVAIQEQLASSNGDGPILLRIGINLGDIIIEDDGDVLGEGVNVAARLEQLADPGGVFVSGKIYEEIEGKIDRAFESRGEQQVKNIARPLRVYALSGTARSANEPKPLPPPHRPSIAVLPFTNMSGDPEVEYFVDGIVEDIITALSRVKWFFVIARNSSFTYKGRAVDVKHVGSELGVRYVLKGSIRRSGDRVRITAQLIDSDTGHHVWADRYDGALADIFDLQDQITQNVVGAIEPQVLAAERYRVERTPPTSLHAWDHVMRAMPHLWAWAEPDSNVALQELQKAIETDQRYGHAHSLLAWTYMTRTHMGWSRLTDALEPAKKAARAAMNLDPDDPWAHLALGYIYMVTRRFQEAIAALQEAVRRNPSFALGHAVLGCAYACAGEGNKGTEHVRLANRLSPRDPQNAFFLTIEGLCAFVEENYVESAELNRRAIQQLPHHTGALRSLSAACVKIGSLDEARQYLSEALALQPGLSARWLEANHPLAIAEKRAVYIAALREGRTPRMTTRRLAAILGRRRGGLLVDDGEGRGGDSLTHSRPEARSR